MSRGEPGADPGDDVALRGGVGARDDADRPWKQGQGAFAVGGEEPLRRQHPLEALDCGEMIAQADSLDRARAEAQIALGLVDLGPPLDEHPLAVQQLELEGVESAALHGRPQARSARGIPEGEEHERPGVVPAQLGHLSLDPQRGQLAQVDPDPLR